MLQHKLRENRTESWMLMSIFTSRLIPFSHSDTHVAVYKRAFNETDEIFYQWYQWLKIWPNHFVTLPTKSSNSNNRQSYTFEQIGFCPPVKRPPSLSPRRYQILAQSCFGCFSTQYNEYVCDEAVHSCQVPIVTRQLPLKWIIQYQYLIDLKWTNQSSSKKVNRLPITNFITVLFQIFC